jgi:hypothetical protein
MTKFLVDENIPSAVARFLRDRGSELKEAAEAGITGAPDDVIMALARKEHRVLLTFDKGIAHWKVSVGYSVFQAIVGLSVLGVKPLGLIPVILLLAPWFSAFFVFSAFVRRSVNIGHAGKFRKFW